MKQTVGVSALAAAALAFAIRSGVQTPPSNQSSWVQNHSVPAAQNPASGATGQHIRHADTIEGPWLATRPFFGVSSNPVQPDLNGSEVDFDTPGSVRDCALATGVCRSELAGFFGATAPGQLRFLIAMVPDPLHSRLSLSTDSSIEAIEKAADNSGWIFANEWLPWVDSANPEEKDPEKRRAERAEIRLQEKQPGLLVFRPRAQAGGDVSSQSVLLIFLVGETPTAGVNPAQFQLARAYMQAINGGDNGKVLIQGPTFSGSFYSLSALLTDDHARYSNTDYVVRSGSATSVHDARLLDRPGINFRGATASTADQDRYFRRALEDLRIEPEEAAMLVEDESAYGAAEVAVAAPKPSLIPGREKKATVRPIRTFRFPRDISHLRNAYRDAVADSKSGQTPSPEIEFSIKDPETGEDSIPVFSGSQTPLAQNGVINRIASAIRRDGIQLVQVNATNVLDMLFLASVLKRECPDTRLLVDFPDVLLVEAAQTEALTGTLVLSSYPGFVASNKWMGGNQATEPFTFSDANAESVYNAAVLLLKHDSDGGQILADYHWRDLPHPPTWLLTMDREGFLPVNVFPHTKQEEVHETWFQPVAAHPIPLRLPVPPRVWSLVSTIIALGCIALCHWIRRISSDATLERDARVSFLQINSEGCWRRVHVIGLLIVLFLIEIMNWIPAWRCEQTGWFEVLSVNVLPALSIGALLYMAWLVASNLKPQGYSRGAMWLVVAAAAASLGLWAFCCLYPDDQSFFFAYRALELRFGSSPTWPIIASLSALGLFAFVHLTRFYLAACQKPDVVTEGIPTALQERLHEAWEDFNSALESSLGFSAVSRTHFSRGLIYLLMAGAVMGMLFRVDLQMRSIDGRSYNLLALCVQLLVMALLLLTCVHIRSLWRSLQSFLASVATLPLAGAFLPTGRAGADRPIWVRRLNLQSLDVHVQAVRVLHDMSILAEDAARLDPAHREYIMGTRSCFEDYAGLIKQLLHVDRSRTREQTRALTVEIRTISKSIAKQTFAYLHEIWLNTRLGDEDVENQPEGDGNEAAPRPEGFVGLAGRFAALHYSTFILYGVRQIQNLLVFLSGGFVLLMLSLDSYSVQAPQFMGRLLMILFLIIGTATFACLAGLERDRVLSRMAGSHPGKLNTDFYLKLAAYGGLPALSLLASQFPSISRFLLSWVEPTLEAFK